MYRQGDVLFIEIADLPEKATERNDPVLVEGEVTGHAHRVESLDTAHIFAVSTLLYIQAVREARILHEEHNTIILPPGNYQVVRQREFVIITCGFPRPSPVPTRLWPGPSGSKQRNTSHYKRHEASEPAQNRTRCEERMRFFLALSPKVCTIEGDHTWNCFGQRPCRRNNARFYEKNIRWDERVSRSTGEVSVGTYRIVVLPGDGIGPEVTAQAVTVLQSVGERFGHTFQFTHALVGVAAINAEGEAISDVTMELCQRSDAILFGAVGGLPSFAGPNSKKQPESALFRLRKELELYANLRPVRPFKALLDASAIKREVLEGTDLLVVRELTGGLYFGKPSEIRETEHGIEAIDTLIYTEAEITRIVRTACELARGRRKKVTSVDKANVLSTSRLWRRVADRVASEFPDITLEHQLVDSCAMQLIRSPRQFDVVVTENMFGDILTDEASMLAGSLGMLPSASLGTRRTAHGLFGLYEPIHGTAPDITGQDKANPSAAILSAALLLRYSLGLHEEADVIEATVERTIARGYRTGDLREEGKTIVGTREMGRIIVEAVESKIV